MENELTQRFSKNHAIKFFLILFALIVLIQFFQYDVLSDLQETYLSKIENNLPNNLESDELEVHKSLEYAISVHDIKSYSLSTYSNSFILKALNISHETLIYFSVLFQLLICIFIFVLFLIWIRHFYKVNFIKISFSKLFDPSLTKLLITNVIFIFVFYILWIVIIPGSIPFKERYLFVFDQSSMLFSIIFLFLFVIIIPLLEEIIFRNYLFLSFLKSFKIIYSKSLISFLFALLYLSFFPFYFSPDVFILFIISYILLTFRHKTDSFFMTYILRVVFQIMMFFILYLSII